MADWKDTYLAGNGGTDYKFTVRQYERERAARNREAIANAIHYRFKERYLDPLADADGRMPKSRPYMHGFTMVAVGCLMIETLESFFQGLANTKDKSRQMFRDFFARDTPFRVFSAKADDFYDGIRCGILHQAETRCAWKIARRGKLLDPPSSTINATGFVGALRNVLNAYRDELLREVWEGTLWTNALRRLDAIRDGCDPASPCKAPVARRRKPRR